MQHPDWVQRWWQHFRRRGDQLQLLTHTHNETLAGIAPLYWERRSRRLRWLGRWSQEPCAFAEYLAPLGVVPQLPTVLATQAFDWPCLQARDLLPIAGARLRQDGLRYVSTQAAPVPSQWRRSDKRFLRDGGQILHTNAQLDWPQAFQTLLALHRARWGRTAPLLRSPLREFIDELGQHWNATGQAEIAIADVGGTALAAALWFRDARFCSYYQSGRIADNRYNTMSVLHRWQQQRGFAQGLAYDFMQSPAPSYKAQYGATAEPLWRLQRR